MVEIQAFSSTSSSPRCFSASSCRPWRNVAAWPSPVLCSGKRWRGVSFLVGILLAILVLARVQLMNPLAGALIGMSFEGGHGTAAGLMDTLSSWALPRSPPGTGPGHLQPGGRHRAGHHHRHRGARPAVRRTRARPDRRRRASRARPRSQRPRPRRRWRRRGPRRAPAGSRQRRRRAYVVGAGGRGVRRRRAVDGRRRPRAVGGSLDPAGPPTSACPSPSAGSSSETLIYIESMTTFPLGACRR